MMTQRRMGSPRKHEQEDLHLQSCGALSSSPSMRRPKGRLTQTTSTSPRPRDSPTSEQSLECKETILWPHTRHFHAKPPRAFLAAGVAAPAADVCRVISDSSSGGTWFIFAGSERDAGQPKWSVSPSALWARAKSSAETVANLENEPASVCRGFFFIWKITKQKEQKRRRMFLPLGIFLQSLISYKRNILGWWRFDLWLRDGNLCFRYSAFVFGEQRPCFYSTVN